jgi:hypothetical protein
MMSQKSKKSQEFDSAMIIVLHVNYLILLIFCMASALPPYHLWEQILFYVFNGIFFVLYIVIEVKRSRLMNDKATFYFRMLFVTVLVCNISSVLSGHHGFTSAFSYNVKSHLFLFLPNMFLFWIKLPHIVNPHIGKADQYDIMDDENENKIKAYFYANNNRMIHVARIFTAVFIYIYITVVIVTWS